MKTAIVAAIIIATAPVVAAPVAAQAQPPGSWQGGPNNRNWDASRSYRAPRHRRDRRMTRNDWVYRGRDGRVYCRRSDGTTGLVVGALAGGLMGNAIGGSPLSTFLGVAGGAALGNSIDRGQVVCR